MDTVNKNSKPTISVSDLSKIKKETESKEHLQIKKKITINISNYVKRSNKNYNF